ncbi:hypothetical protein B0H17DRAFT_1089613 [Mycena rosella]|uniref:Uncharacterized protein n=1 Tax=Mycena rosella TaxID=1033263 RepID=A0AAD7G4G8_MYCRO|nr:hypothetical protein B0H17DRAFT_1089613 [Mycena rosella]
MHGNYMEDIVRREKSYEFRRYRLAPSVQRIWFYLTAPRSHIAYICEIDPARTRAAVDAPLPEDGMLGNAEFNSVRGGEWTGYDYAYRVRSVWRVKEAIGLTEMKKAYGIGGAPRGMVYVPEGMKAAVVWNEQECVWDEAETRGLSECLRAGT